ncbi:hypothetical protein RJD24_11175 [Bacillaceae bacterium IKA-2]|nr:hypothetical protein RJD24_11175 [Bacillaceae bacterium IKA-2]
MVKKVAFLLLAMIIMMTSITMLTGVSLASETKEPTEGTRSLHPDEGTSSDENPFMIESTQYIKVWESLISRTGNNIRVSGFSETYSTVDTIGVKLFIQYWNGQKWIDLESVGDFKKNNTNYVNGIGHFTVSSGFYYRTRGVHYVRHNGLTEQVNSYTSYIYVP